MTGPGASVGPVTIGVLVGLVASIVLFAVSDPAGTYEATAMVALDEFVAPEQLDDERSRLLGHVGADEDAQPPGVSVAMPRSASVIVVTGEAADPQVAAGIANAFAQNLVDAEIEARVDAITRELTTQQRVLAELGETRGAMQPAIAALAEIEAEQQAALVTLAGRERAAAEDALAQTQAQRTEVRAQRDLVADDENRARRAVLRAQLDADMVDGPVVLPAGVPTETSGLARWQLAAGTGVLLAGLVAACVALLRGGTEPR